MSIVGSIFTSLFRGTTPPSPAEVERQVEWQSAFEKKRLPSFVKHRLQAAAAGKAPWLATMTPAELRLARSHGIRPLGMVSGTCCRQYGQLWSHGHAAGWHQALTRLKQQAVAIGANAVVDVGLRKAHLATEDSMDFTIVGTAIRIAALRPGKEPVVATVPALEFVRLLEAEIVPVGIAIGAQDAHLDGDRLTNLSVRGGASGSSMLRCYPASRLGSFWEKVRRQALVNLRQDAQRQGNGVLAHTHFGQILWRKGEGDRPAGFIGRYIVIGTVVDTPRAADGISHEIRAVVDMRGGVSPLLQAVRSGHNAYPVREEEGAI
jgi:hypothetical protein